ncbi:class I fructose-bisphosphate aldolase [bacterium]|nr:class I fructose-bisphosphate aldolase [bacterium]MDB4128639.1 class I fructose-bisphosphate aldolase [bacterium]MDC1257071.1 class I fructose-bisphosphate aldolase [bacterium]
MSQFIAAMDHSGGSTGGVLNRYGQEYTEEDKMEKVHAMRLRMVNSPDFNSDNIWAAILYKDSIDRGLHNVLAEKGIMVFLKVDSGCNPDGTLKQFPVKQMINFANRHAVGAFGTKMRSIVTNINMVNSVVEQQFVIASNIIKAGLMPIIEPEVPIDSPNKAEIEQALLVALKLELNKYDGKCILKLTPPEQPNLYQDLTTHKNINRVVFLSGGYPTMEACRRLSANEGISASFSRALSEGLNFSLTDQEFDAKMKQNIKMITEAGK